MSSSCKSCVNNPDVFCCICGEYIFKENRKTVSDFVKRVYLGYFCVRLGDQDKTWALHQVLQQWSNRERNGLKFTVPTVKIYYFKYKNNTTNFVNKDLQNLWCSSLKHVRAKKHNFGLKLYNTICQLTKT